ncbi:9939_t:CDS:2 [Funneliformis geosporum]|uniref:5599_t:CDS:1 n=1 Tax=Funneliformis geosporum TaxID=1117311 RepID=A0A9W4SMH3_9GLOM|nr:9939_t:CDS:2 [Funneliformis geosporum]CAI2174501.1 5599_t:CDS:2 [Funneliformis geosporum]
MNILKSQKHNSTQPQEVVYFNIKKNVKHLSRSKSTNPPTQKGSNNSLIRRNSSNDTILGVHSYFDKELPPPPPYSNSPIDDPNSTTITTTTTTTTVTTVTTTTISNSGESTSKQQNVPDMTNNDSNDSEIPSITIVSYDSCDTNKNETEIITPSISIPPDNEILPENSNPVFLNIDVNSQQRRHIRSGSAPNVHTLLFKEQTDLKYKKNTVPSASSVNLPDSRRDTVFLNNSYKETPQQYLDKLRDTLSKSELATLLTKSKDVFHETVLRTYMETFDFTRDPVDIALRKFLMDCHLPKETQQIDRVMEAFAKRYYECNPDLFPSSDTVYVLAFSMLMLHTDAFNKSVKRKMTKEEFVKNTKIEGCPPEVLEILYDNITFTRFIYADDDIDVNGQTMLSSSHKSRHSIIFGLLDRSSCIKNDPYFVIKHNIRTDYTPSIEHIVPSENPFSYKGTLPEFDTVSIHRAFTTAHTIRITGVRTQRNSESFNQISSSIHPLGDDEGSFLLKITKAGKLCRKVDLLEGKKSGVIRNWSQYGIILSGSQIMMFKDDEWFNSKISDLKDPSKSTILPTLKPDVILMTSDSVALYDKSYTKYNHVFRLVCPKGNQYLFQAENEVEMNDWITKINYAATFKTVGLKMRHTRCSSLNHSKSIRADSGTPKRQTFLQSFFNYQQNCNDDNNVNDAHSRAEVLRTKIEELEEKINMLRSQIEIDIRFRNNLIIMIPYKAITRDRIIQVATELGKRIRTSSLELSRLDCYHEIMGKDLYSTTIGDNFYWQNGSINRNHSHKRLSHIVTTRKNHHHRRSHSKYTKTTSDDDINIKTRPVTLGAFHHE